RSVTRGATDRPRPVSLLRNVAEEEDVSIEPNGFYVPPHDPDALRRALVYLLDHPEDRARLGAAGRRAVEQLMTVDQFADRLALIVEVVLEHENPAAAGSIWPGPVRPVPEDEHPANAMRATGRRVS